jgi:putative ABC transport system permease protein
MGLDYRSVNWLDQWWLDIKLSLRMLVRYPGLTAVGAAGLAVALAIATGSFVLISTLLAPSLPLDEGERVVSLQLWNAETRSPVLRASAEFQEWQRGLTTIQPVGAYRQVTRNLILPGHVPEVVRVAEMSASGFEIARIPPFLGRPLIPADERAGAPPVMVVGHGEWMTRFGADASIVGRAVQLAGVPHTVVGVMPEGFAFPVNHQYWVPLQIEPAIVRLQGPELRLFGRLTPEATLAAAQAELTAIGRRLSADFPETHARLQLRVVPYTYPFSDMDDPENQLGMRLLQVLVIILLGLVAVNVSILVYARTAARSSEIAVRTALGASRGRIVAQLFVEALALSLVAAALGLALVAGGVRWVAAALMPIMGGLPFWFELEITPHIVLYAAALAVLTAAIVGVLPALKATGHRVQRRLQHASSTNAGIRLGTTWTLLVVGQVAVAAALLPTPVYFGWYAIRQGLADPAFRGDEFLRARMVMDPDATSRQPDRLAELLRRVRSEPAFRSATFSLTGPGEEPVAWVAVEGVTNPTEPDDFSVAAGSSIGHQVRINKVEPGWFDVFGVTLLSGRTLSTADPRDDAVVVNRTFVDRMLSASTALGARFQYAGVSGDARPEDVELERWYRIIGIVEDFPADPAGRRDARIYHAALAGDVSPPLVAVHVRSGDALRLANRLREIAAAIDPGIQLQGVDRLDAPALAERAFYRIVASGLLAVIASVLVLSAAGIYAMMSCTVSQRKREIGIRTALGGQQRRILGSIFARAFGQLGAGAILGMSLAFLLGPDSPPMDGYRTIVVPLVAAALVCVGLLAASGPARRALGVSPSDALRAE